MIPIPPGVNQEKREKTVLKAKKRRSSPMERSLP
jgi:hypothetical protein